MQRASWNSHLFKSNPCAAMGSPPNQLEALGWENWSLICWLLMLVARVVSAVFCSVIVVFLSLYSCGASQIVLLWYMKRRVICDDARYDWSRTTLGWTYCLLRNQVVPGMKIFLQLLVGSRWTCVVVHVWMRSMWLYAPPTVYPHVSIRTIVFEIWVIIR